MVFFHVNAQSVNSRQDEADVFGVVFLPASFPWPEKTSPPTQLKTTTASTIQFFSLKIYLFFSHNELIKKHQ